MNKAHGLVHIIGAPSPLVPLSPVSPRLFAEMRGRAGDNRPKGTQLYAGSGERRLHFTLIN